jgi:ISXO2-like transposase domain
MDVPFAVHSTVDHKAGEYVRQDLTTNHAETYFSRLRRSFDGIFHHVSHERIATSQSSISATRRASSATLSGSTCSSAGRAEGG